MYSSDDDDGDDDNDDDGDDENDDDIEKRVGERRLPWARRAFVSPRPQPPTLNDDHPQQDLDDDHPQHVDDDDHLEGDVVSDYDCADHHEHSVQPQHNSACVHITLQLDLQL